MTKIGQKRTIPQLPLKRKTSLRARKGLNKISDKQRRRNIELAKIKPPTDGLCEECKQKPDWRGLVKHHRVFRSHSGVDTRNNIEWLCGKCHSLRHMLKEI